MRTFLTRAALGAALAIGPLLCSAGQARAQTISMTPAPATPELHAPFLYATRPGTPFLFTIPATGQAPLSFAASGLPDGLTIDAATGTITGTAPAAGAYPIAITASNAAGAAAATYTLQAGNTAALTPPMGWNSYDSYGATVKEDEFLAAAKALKAQLQPYGFSTAVVDYLWFDSEDSIDSNGRWLPSPTKWPSSTGGQGLKPVADQVHGMGLLFGIHIMRGIPRKALTANTPIANSTYKAADAGNSSDTCPWDSHNYGVRGDTAAGQAWYDSIVAQYAGWGVDFIKIDDMISGTNFHQTEVDAIRAAIDKSGRTIVLSLSPGPMQTANVADLNANANMWRTVNDFWDTNGLSNLADVFTAAGNWQGQTTLTAGHWPDCDMLPLGYIGPRAPVGGGSRTGSMTALAHTDQVSVMSLWGIMPSPLIFGGNPTKLSGDAWTTALLGNPEVLAINQDASGAHARRISSSGSSQVWTRDLSGGRKAVALFNRGTAAATVSATFAQLGVTGTPAVRDVWQRQDVGGMTAGLSAMVAAGSAAMYVLSSPDATGTGGAAGNAGGGGKGSGGAGPGSGGAGGPGGAASTGGAPGGGSGGAGGASGGATGSGGVTGSGGRAGSGGIRGSGGDSASGGAPGSGGTASDGAPGSGGSMGATGSGGSGPASPAGASGASNEGCACSIATETPPAPWIAAGAIAFACANRRRRRR